MLLPRLGWCSLLGKLNPRTIELEHLSHCRNLASLSLFYGYYFGRCSSELTELVPLPYSRKMSPGYSHIQHDFSVTIPRSYQDVDVYSYNLFAKPRLKSVTCPSPPFQAIPLYIWFFVTPPPPPAHYRHTMPMIQIVSSLELIDTIYRKILSKQLCLLFSSSFSYNSMARSDSSNLQGVTPN